MVQNEPKEYEAGRHVRERVSIFYHTTLLSVDSGVPATFTGHVNPSHFKVPHGMDKQTQ